MRGSVVVSHEQTLGGSGRWASRPGALVASAATAVAGAVLVVALGLGSGMFASGPSDRDLRAAYTAGLTAGGDAALAALRAEREATAQAPAGAALMGGRPDAAQGSEESNVCLWFHLYPLSYEGSCPGNAFRALAALRAEADAAAQARADAASVGGPWEDRLCEAPSHADDFPVNWALAVSDGGRERSPRCRRSRRDNVHLDGSFRESPERSTARSASPTSQAEVVGSSPVSRSQTRELRRPRLTTVQVYRPKTPSALPERPLTQSLQTEEIGHGALFRLFLLAVRLLRRDRRDLATGSGTGWISG